MKTKAESFKTIVVGKSHVCRVVYDQGNVPQGLQGGERFITSEGVQYCFEKKFPKGSGVTFVGYVIMDHPSSSDEYDNIMYRVAVFRFDNDDMNRVLSADEIERVK